MKTVEEQYAGATLRYRKGDDGMYHGVVIKEGSVGEQQSAADKTTLIAILKNLAGRLHPDYIGINGAINRFSRFFPSGFEDSLYAEWERNYKIARQQKLASILPLDAALNCTNSQASEVRKAYHQTNILSRYELARMQDVLNGETGADFVKGAARFTTGAYNAGLIAMQKAIKPHGRCSWPIVTYLPNLWMPEKHMFLKPEATKDFASRIGHPFAEEYAPDLSADIYEALLQLVEDTQVDIASLSPQDNIDVQSFIWVVGSYTDQDLEKIDRRREGLREDRQA